MEDCIEKFEFNPAFTLEKPCANYDIFVGSFSYCGCSVVLTHAYNGGHPSFVVEAYIHGDKADEIDGDEEILTMNREGIYRYLESVNFDIRMDYSINQNNMEA